MWGSKWMPYFSASQISINLLLLTDYSKKSSGTVSLMEILDSRRLTGVHRYQLFTPNHNWNIVMIGIPIKVIHIWGHNVHNNLNTRQLNMLLGLHCKYIPALKCNFLPPYFIVTSNAIFYWWNQWQIWSEYLKGFWLKDPFICTYLYWANDIEQLYMSF